MLTRLVQGAIAGLTATVPMTAAMKIGADQLPRHERYPLPPRLITKELARKSGVSHDLTESEVLALTIAAHFGYGATMGAAYSAMTPPKWTGPLTGIAFGLRVWASSYLGALPGLNLLRPATKHPARRNALMIAAHVVWGSALGAALHALDAGSDGNDI
jgi:hypothetical protein